MASEPTPLSDGHHPRDGEYASATQLSGAEKRSVLTRLFDEIAPVYDRHNLVVSLGQTSLWRRWALAELRLPAQARILDVGCGTGRSLQELRRRFTDATLEGLDVSPRMLEVAHQIEPTASYRLGDVQAIDATDNTYDAVVTMYTTRNFPELRSATAELLRVVKPGGSLLILDSFPVREPAWLGAFFRWWMGKAVPTLIGLMGNAEPYRYLARSIDQHVTSGEYAAMLEELGGHVITRREYSFGAATCLLVRK